MDFRGYISALAGSWVSLMSGIASVILAFMGAYYAFYKKQDLPARALWTAALICFFLASVQVWTKENKKVQQYENNANAPYVVLDYATNPNGPSGFTVRNLGQDPAIRIQINDVRTGNRIARFGELVMSQSNGGQAATYSEDDDLDNVLMGFPVDEKGHAQVTATVDYWALDNMRKFRTTCVFRYYNGQHRADLMRSSRELMVGGQAL